MGLSLFDATVPTLLRAIGNLASVLAKGGAHCEQEKIDPPVLLTARLYPDMFSLTRQVQVAADVAKRGAARLAQVEAPRYEDDESSFDALAVRLEKTADFLRGVKPGSFQGAEGRPVEVKQGPRTMQFADGWDFLFTFVLPNVYFHSATAYDILRHNGVKLGKPDFLGAIRLV